MTTFYYILALFLGAINMIGIIAIMYIVLN